MRLIAMIAVVGLLAAIAQPASADMADDCVQDYDPDLQIGGCTAVIQSGMFADNPGNLAVAYYNRGTAYADLGEFRRAIEDYDQALRIEPGWALAYYNRGTAYHHLGEYAQAIEDYNLALRIDPGLASAYNNRAMTLYRLGRNAEALGDVDRALSIDPGSAIRIDTRAHVLAALGRRREALAEFERAMQIGGADRVRKYQEALARHGYYRGAIDGAYGAGIRAALVACLDAECRLLE